MRSNFYHLIYLYRMERMVALAANGWVYENKLSILH